MSPFESNPNLPARRRLLGTMASVAGAAALGIGANAAQAQTGSAESSHESEELFAPARLRDYKTRRSSSWDRTGANGDAVAVNPGKEAVVLDTTGAGVVTHLWFTINSPDPMHLKNLVLRAWWDGESSPSIESPIGDFFGLGLGEYYTYQSELLAVASMKALNAYFKMPFATAARISVANEGTIRCDNLYFAVDYVTVPQLPENLGRLHAQYRQAAPCKASTDNWTNEYAPDINGKKNLSGEGNYIFLEATGRGHFIGVTQAVLQNQDQWFGEGDDMIFIDGDTAPTINGTGTEDYYNGAWGFGSPFAYQHNGAPFMVDQDHIGGRLCLYRWHTESPITFEKSIRVTIEHGHGNHRADNFYSTAFWYQTEPHAAFPALSKPAERVPRILRVGGAGAAAPPSE
jgi:hypothetical protein